MRREGIFSIDDLPALSTDPAHLFMQLYDLLPEQLFAGRTPSGWLADAEVRRRASRVEESVLDLGTVDPHWVARIVRWSGPRGAFTILLGLDHALWFVNPYSAVIDHGGLDWLALRYAMTGTFNDQKVSSGALLPRCAYPGRPRDLGHKADFFSVHRVPPEHLHTRVQYELMEARYQPAFHPERPIPVACAPFLGSFEELAVTFAKSPGATTYRLAPAGANAPDHHPASGPAGQEPTGAPDAAAPGPGGNSRDSGNSGTSGDSGDSGTSGDSGDSGTGDTGTALTERITSILDGMDAAGARIGVLPEGCLSDELFQQWRRAARDSARPDKPLRWLLLGSGPLDGNDPPANRAVLLDRWTGDTLLTHDKLERFALDADQARAWRLPGAPSTGPVHEDITVGSTVAVRDSSLGRLAVLVCQDLASSAGWERELISLGVSHLLVPIFSKPIYRYRWEQQAAERQVSNLGAWVVIANSLVVANALGESAGREWYTCIVAGPSDPDRARWGADIQLGRAANVADLGWVTGPDGRRRLPTILAGAARASWLAGWEPATEYI